MDMLRTAFNYALGGVLGITIGITGFVLAIALLGWIVDFITKKCGDE